MTVDNSELLFHIAEISVAFAGFVSIASVLRDHADHSEIRVDAGRLVNMLIASLSTAMLSLFPLVPELFRASDATIWKVSGLTGLVLMLILVPGVAMRTRRMMRYEGFNKQASWLNFTLVAIAALGFCGSVAGFPVDNPGASYLAGLIALLFACGILFFHVIVSLLRPHAPD